MLKKVIDIAFNLIAIWWFFAVLMWFIGMLPLYLVLMQSDIASMFTSGFSTLTVGESMLFVFALIFGITMIVPPLRRCYKKLPWLYTYVVIFMADVAIMTIGEEILNYGYQVKNDTRHIIFTIIMILQIVACRVLMCIFFKKNPPRLMKEKEYE